jgi:hypothetical protein
MATDPKSLERGMLLLHRNGSVRELSRRKPDDSGWWMTDGSGLADAAWNSGDWKVVTQEALQRLWEETDDTD